MAGVKGFEPLECRSQSPMPYHLAIPQYKNGIGWDRWIRTIGMTESKSVALPLGYIPISFPTHTAFILYHGFTSNTIDKFYFYNIETLY